MGILLGREYRDELETALLRVQRTGVTWVGPPLDPPFDEAEYYRVFAALAQEGAQGIIVADEPANVRNIRLIVDLTEKGRLPAIYPYREFIEAGGLMNYGIEIPALGRRAADMAVQILKGAKPSECRPNSRCLSTWRRRSASPYHKNCSCPEVIE